MKSPLNPALLIFLSLFLISFQSTVAQVKTGIEVLADRDFDLLQGKRVGLVTNPTGIDGQLRSTIDILYKHVNPNVTRLISTFLLSYRPLNQKGKVCRQLP